MGNIVGVHAHRKPKTKTQVASAADVTLLSQTKRTYLGITAALEVTPSEAQVQDGHSQAPHVEATIHSYAGVLLPSGTNSREAIHIPHFKTVGKKGPIRNGRKNMTQGKDPANQVRRSEQGKEDAEGRSRQPDATVRKGKIFNEDAGGRSSQQMRGSKKGEI